MQQISERILLTIWIGGMWAVGYIVAPTLFAMIDDRMLAGSIAGRLFTIISFIGLFAAGFLLLTMLLRDFANAIHQWRAWALIIMLVLIIAGEFMLQPQMSALREGGILESEKSHFGMLHGISSALFLINSLIGLALVIFGLHKPR